MDLCRACGKEFRSTYAFDKHRTGKFSDDSRRCRTTEEMLQIGMVQNSKGVWVSEVREVPQPVH